MAVRLSRCWHCGFTTVSHPGLFQFVSQPNKPMDMHTCDCLKEPWPDEEEANYGEVE